MPLKRKSLYVQPPAKGQRTLVQSFESGTKRSGVDASAAPRKTKWKDDRRSTGEDFKMIMMSRGHVEPSFYLRDWTVFYRCMFAMAIDCFFSKDYNECYISAIRSRDVADKGREAQHPAVKTMIVDSYDATGVKYDYLDNRMMEYIACYQLRSMNDLQDYWRATKKHPLVNEFVRILSDPDFKLLKSYPPPREAARFKAETMCMMLFELLLAAIYAHKSNDYVFMSNVSPEIKNQLKRLHVKHCGALTGKFIADETERLYSVMAGYFDYERQIYVENEEERLSKLGVRRRKQTAELPMLIANRAEVANALTEAYHNAPVGGSSFPSDEPTPEAVDVWADRAFVDSASNILRFHERRYAHRIINGNLIVADEDDNEDTRDSWESGGLDYNDFDDNDFTDDVHDDNPIDDDDDDTNYYRMAYYRRYGGFRRFGRFNRFKRRRFYRRRFF